MNTGQDGQTPGRFDPVTGVRIWALDKVCPTGEDNCPTVDDNEKTLEVLKILDGMDTDDEAWMAEECFDDGSEESAKKDDHPPKMVEDIDADFFSILIPILQKRRNQIFGR